MVLGHAMLNVVPGRESEFEAAFAQARRLISAMPGFLSLELGRNAHAPNRYVLLVKWRAVEDHTDGFRKSQEYVEWSRLLHGFYEPFPPSSTIAPCNRSSFGVYSFHANITTG
jgi:heme-degrading monooxygenase HmoA